MKRLKILLCTTVAILMSLCLFACGPEKEPDPEPNPGVETVEITHHDRTVTADVYRPNRSRFPIVIFSHGFNGSKDDFKETAEYLMECGIGSVTVQFCGSGVFDKSGFPSTSMTLFTEKEDLIAVMDYAKSLEWFNGNLYLLGGSQGGMVSAMAGHERAQDLKGMILLFPAFNIPTDWKNMYPTDESVPEVIENFNGWGVDLGRDFVLSMRDLDIYAGMEAFTKPVLIMHGSRDSVVLPSYSERAVETYPNAELIVYPGEGHGFTASTMRGDVADKLLDFIY